MDSLYPQPGMRAGLAATGIAEALIARSWQRSVDRYRLDPGRREAPRVLSASALRDHLEPMQPVLELARGALQRLFEQVRDAGYVVLMTDADGVAVCMMHEPRQDRELRHAGLYRGSAWQEPTEGTCAVALSVLEKVALTVHHAEHFRAVNRSLTCSAAPVLAPDGRVLAVIDASALSSPDDKRSQHLVLQMVRQAARLVEDAWFLQSYADQWVLKIGSQQSLVEVATDALLAVDGDGRVLAGNAGFLAASGLQAAALAGQPLHEVLGVDLPTLCAAGGEPGQAALRLQLPAQARPSYGLLRPPRAAAAPRRVATPPQARAATPPLHPALAALAGTDAAMQAHARRGQRLLDKGVNLLLQGESGTGKEAFAKALHAASARRDGPFVAINCAAIPESLIESELFGYSAGSFTGAARHGARGRIAQAQHGTLFLDEIGDMPLALQTRLLRVLAEREVQALGAREATALDAQVICASHRDLLELAERGQFRLDLYYRIHGLSLRLPALRERDDRRALVDRVLAEEAARLGLDAPPIDADARGLLDSHDWPGNLRELRNAMRALLAMGEGGSIGRDLVEAAIRPRAARADLPAPLQRNAHDGFALAEQARALREALQDCRGNVSEAARRLGIGRATMYRRMQRLGVAPPQRLFDPGQAGD